MNIIFVLIPVSLLLVGVAIAAFFWAVRTGQFDDLETPGWRVLLDDNRPSDASTNADSPPPDRVP